MRSLLDSAGIHNRLCCQRQRSAGAYSAIREAGLSIPTDLSVVGFDDILAAFIEPALQQYVCEIAELYHLLMRLMKYDFPNSREAALPTDLVLRNSTAPYLKIGKS